VTIVGHDEAETRSFSRIEPGNHAFVDVELPGANIPEGVPLSLEITIRQRSPRAGAELELVERHQVPRAKRLMERTVDQVEFENMF
jgi:hypothetical protein